jgi:hypothetical protein
VNMCLVPNGYRDREVWSWGTLFLFVGFVGMDGERSLQKEGGYMRQSAHILYATARTKKRTDQLRRITRDLRTRVAKCTDVDGGIVGIYR